MKTTKEHQRFWKNRKIDWEQSYISTWNHPHRQLIIWALSTFPWISLWEVGVGGGANLVRIVKEGEKNPRFQGKQLGGSDINAEAVAVAQKTFKGGKFHCETSEDMLLSDDAVDVVLSDASLIYIGPTKIRKVIKEFVRIGRSHLVLSEFHSTSLWRRWWFRWKTGYNVYDYKKLLEEEGCFNIQVIKMTPEFWPESKKGDGWHDFGHVILARLV